MNRWSTQHSLPTVGAILAWSILVLGTAGCIGLWSELPDFDYCEDESDCGTDEQCVQGHCVGEDDNSENAGEVISNQTGNSNAGESNAESNQTGNSGGSNGEYNGSENVEENDSNSGQNDGNSGQNDGNSEQNDGNSGQNDGNSGQNDGNSGQNDENCGETSPPPEIQIVLDWDPQDVEPDSEANVGTDLGIHYAPAGIPFGDDNAIFWRERKQDWGDDGCANLDVDDLWGEYPEILAHEELKTDDGRFKIGVHYYCDKGFGASDATLDVYFDEIQVTKKERELNATGHFWYVGDVVVGDTTTFEEVDEYYEDPVGDDFDTMYDCGIYE